MFHFLTWNCFSCWQPDGLTMGFRLKEAGGGRKRFGFTSMIFRFFNFFLMALFWKLRSVLKVAVVTSIFRWSFVEEKILRYKKSMLPNVMAWSQYLWKNWFRFFYLTGIHKIRSNMVRSLRKVCWHLIFYEVAMTKSKCFLCLVN